MALVPCKRCGKQISSESSACRHCGVKLGAHPSMYKPRPNFFAHYLVSMLIAICGAGLYVAVMNGSQVSPLVAAAGPVMGIGGTLYYVCARIWAYMV